MKGISPLVATLLLILIVIAGGMTLYILYTSLVNTASEESKLSLTNFTVSAYVDVGSGAFNEYSYWGRVFRIITTPKTFEEALEYCKSIGYHLSTTNQYTYLSDRLTELGITSAWIGVYRDPNTNSWRLIIDEDAVKTYWNTGEPNCPSCNAAVLLSNGTWDDRNELETHPFICERAATKFSVQNIGDTVINPDALYVEGWDTAGTKVAFSLQANSLISIDINVGGTVKTFTQRYIYPNRTIITPGTSGTFTIAIIPGMNFNPPRICVYYQGVKACDTVEG